MGTKFFFSFPLRLLDRKLLALQKSPWRSKAMQRYCVTEVRVLADIQQGKWQLQVKSRIGRKQVKTERDLGRAHPTAM